MPYVNYDLVHLSSLERKKRAILEARKVCLFVFLSINLFDGYT